MKLLKFYADWCGPCKQISATLSEIDHGLEIQEVDADNDRATVVQYGVRAIPTLVLLDDNGVELRRATGGKTKTQLLQFLNIA